MAFVVQWTPVGSDISVTLPTSEDVAELTRELASTGNALNIRVIEDGEPVKIRASQTKRPGSD
jgi:hypothetical protein